MAVNECLCLYIDQYSIFRSTLVEIIQLTYHVAIEVIFCAEWEAAGLRGVRGSVGYGAVDEKARGQGRRIDADGTCLLCVVEALGRHWHNCELNLSRARTWAT